jgi:hypothetical protein
MCKQLELNHCAVVVEFCRQRQCPIFHMLPKILWEKISLLKTLDHWHWVGHLDSKDFLGPKPKVFQKIKSEEIFGIGEN